MIFLRQSTASQEVPLGHFVDDADGKTAETGLTIANTDIKVWKTGATTLASKNSGGATHISGGVYYAVLDATDTDTVGPLVIFVAVSGALAVRLECCVVEEAVYDAFYASSAPGYVANAPVNVAQISGDSTSADNLESYTDGGAAMPVKVTQWGDSGADLSASTANNLPLVGVGDFESAQLTSIQSECNDALVAYDPPTKAELDSGFAALNDLSSADVQTVIETNRLDELMAASVSVFPAAGSVFAELLDSSEFSSSSNLIFSTAALANAPNDTGLDAAGVRTAVGLASANLDTQLAATKTVADAILVDTGTDGVVVASGSKSGYSLSSSGLDSISTTAPSGVASNFREMIVQLWRRFFKKSTLTSTELKTYADNGSTVVTTQTVSNDGTTQTQGTAS